ncbi:MAG: DEAD/DEAH box helicase family protein [Clostridia bacterium]|nr:DEAD/DEAH box helicase family protein [Clostridia bacterium]
MKRAKEEAQKREKEELEKKKRKLERQKKAEEERNNKEHARQVTSMDLPLTWENAFASDSRASGIHAESPADGLWLSLENLGRVDIEYIAEITDSPVREVISALRGSIYQNPDTWDECFYKGWETAEQYLSGNMANKLRIAEEANKKYYGWFDANIKAIKNVLPPTVSSGDIYVTLGSPWVPPDIIDDFIVHLFGRPRYTCFDEENDRTKHDPLTGSWEIPFKSRYNHSVAMTGTYGTSKIEALHLLERTLNLKTVVITDKKKDPNAKSGYIRVVNQADTALAQEKQKRLIEEFQKWVWDDPQRKDRLVKIFDSKFGCVKSRNFSGAFLTFPTMNPAIQLRPYQKDAVARILFSPNTLLAHDVGAGKTYIMIAAGMELRRTGRSDKNLYVVPNSIVGQWETILKFMYPSANLLVVDPKSFPPAKRENILRRIQNEDFDAIIMAYSCFEQIPISKEFHLKELQAREQLLAEFATGLSVTKTRRAALERINDALNKLISELENSYDGVYFDNLGITRLFVDEAHNYKNLPLETKLDNVLGINSKGSKKCAEMLGKVHAVQKQNCGGGVVFATGTPVTNSVTEVYAMQQYLQSGELALLGLGSFDSWIGMFAETVTDFEIDVDTSTYRLATRFAKFHNLPELTNMLAGFADFHSMDELAQIPAMDGYDDIAIGKTPALEAYLGQISVRADMVRSKIVTRREDNMLLITTDGRKAALDVRLVGCAGTGTNSKVYRCAENVRDIYFKTAAQRSTQLVFCDVSVPKQAFNIYDELKALLCGFGIPENEIAYVHSADTEIKRQKLFADVRSGSVRVLIGSTFKLGIGVNVQDKLIALHHLDVPWRPADMVQREGRILRQGNENKKVQIFRYITEGSFDAYSWQLLETKQRFISELLSGSLTARSGSDISDTVLDYAEVKALAIGDERIKERVETANELGRLISLQSKGRAEQMRLKAELAALPSSINNCREKLMLAEKDARDLAEWKRDRHEPVTKAEKDSEIERRRALRERLFCGLSENVMQKQKQKVFAYSVFDVFLPANMMKEKPFVWLEHHGKYYVETGSSEVGGLIRLDNFIEDFSGRVDEMRDALDKLLARKSDIEHELAADTDYGDKIEKLAKKLKDLDKDLGVIKK